MVEGTNIYNPLTCPKGNCALNTLTGNKRCPINNQEPLIIESDELCINFGINECKETFKNPVISNGGTSNTYTCESIGCSCIQNRTCPSYITQKIVSNSSNVFTPLLSQSSLFSWDSSSNTIPISQIGTNFCTITPSWINRINPGCNISGTVNNDLIMNCFNKIYSNNTFRICDQGTLAYITDDYTNFNENSLMNTQMGCVNGNSCQNQNEIPIYDTTYGGIICKQF